MRFIAQIIVVWMLFAFSAFGAEPETFYPPKSIVPNFAKDPTIRSIKSGPWSDLSTWDQGRIPTDNDIVKVEAAHTISYGIQSMADLLAIGVEGKLAFDPDSPTRIKFGTLIVYPDGELEIGTQGMPISPDVTTEVIIADRALNNDPDDPEFWRNGIIVLGKFHALGEDKGNVMVQLAYEVLAGQSVIAFAGDISKWKVGDKIEFPHTKRDKIVHLWSFENPAPIPSNNEVAVIQSIGANNTITLENPLRFDHKGNQSEDGQRTFTPHAANQTRNVIIRSENPNGARGHIIATGRADVDVKYIGIYGMGRTTSDPLNNTVFDENGQVAINPDTGLLMYGTNQIGRYPLHFHHLMGPVNPSNTGLQGDVYGLAIVDCEKWCISFHNFHFGRMMNNHFSGASGAGIMTEEGNEHDNLIAYNSIFDTGTSINGFYDPRYGGVAGLEPFRPLGFKDFGYEGSATWFGGSDNRVIGNVCGGAAFACHMINQRISGFSLLNPRVPKHRGADIDNDDHWIQYTLNQFAPSVMEFRDNIGYGAAVGLWVSFSGDVGTISNTVLWNIRQDMVYATRNLRILIDGIVGINTFTDTFADNYRYHSKCFNFGNPRYATGHNTVRNAFMEGCLIGVDLPHAIKQNEPQLGIITPKTTVFEDSEIRSYVVARDHSGIHGYDKETFFKNVKFDAVPGAPVNPVTGVNPVAAGPSYFVGVLEGSISIATSTKRSRIIVEDFNGVQGDDFQVFFKHQSPGYVMTERKTPQGYVPPLDNCPTVGLTNQQCWNQHGVAMLGEVATCANTMALIDGYACPLGGSPLPPLSFEIDISGSSTAILGQPYTITVTPRNGNIDTILVDWGDDSVQDSDLTHTYTNACNHTVTVTAQSGTSQVVKTHNVNVTCACSGQ